MDSNFSIYRECEEMKGLEEGKFIGWYLLADGEKISLDKLMDDCIEAWKSFLIDEILGK
jgi:hypothetical protein